MKIRSDTKIKLHNTINEANKVAKSKTYSAFTGLPLNNLVNNLVSQEYSFTRNPEIEPTNPKVPPRKSCS